MAKEQSSRNTLLFLSECGRGVDILSLFHCLSLNEQATTSSFLHPFFSFIDAMYDMVNSNSVILYAGGIFMVAFVCSVMGKFNALEQRVIFNKDS